MDGDCIREVEARARSAWEILSLKYGRWAMVQDKRENTNRERAHKGGGYARGKKSVEARKRADERHSESPSQSGGVKAHAGVVGVRATNSGNMDDGRQPGIVSRRNHSERRKRLERVNPPKKANRQQNNEAQCEENKVSEKSVEKAVHSEKRKRLEGSSEGVRKSAIRNPRELVVETLMRIEDGGYSNIVWDLAIRHADLSNLDKMLATRIFYGTLSNMRLIDALWDAIEPEMLRRADPVVKMTLRSAMYQLYFLDRVPAYSIVSTSVDVVKRLRNRAACGYCNALLRKAVLRKEKGELTYQETGNALQDFAIRYSLNEDLASLLMEEFGSDAPEIAESMLSVPRMVLRVNRSRISLESFLSEAGASVERSVRLPGSACSVLSRHRAIDEAIERGDVCVQDEAAQIAVAALGLPNEWGNGGDEVHIWDSCAGLGGKSIHLLDEIACETGERRYCLLSTDLYANKLERLREYQQKFFKDAHLLTKARDLTVGGSVQLAPFDVILVDAPCSGLGVLRRHPEVKLYRTRDAIESLAELQKTILDNVCRHLRVGGVLVYAVCTITRAECEAQARAFLERHPNYAFDALPEACTSKAGEAEIKLLPHSDGCDGFYVVRFKRLS